MHPDWRVLGDSWRLAMQADGYSPNTVRTYQTAVSSLATWTTKHHPDVGPVDLTREHVRGWLVAVRRDVSAASARSWLAGIRHFCRFLVDEGEAATDASAGVKTPAPRETPIRVLTVPELRRLLKACQGSGFTDRRDAAVILVLADAGLRLSELTRLQVADVDLRDRVLYIVGKGSRRGGPRHRAVPVGVKAARGIDRYLRARRTHPDAHLPGLWLGTRGQGALSHDGIEKILHRRAAKAGIEGLTAHMFRHTWASQFRQDGGSEGDLLVLGGWRSRAQLDRYGRATAEERAAEAARRHSLADRL